MSSFLVWLTRCSKVPASRLNQTLKLLRSHGQMYRKVIAGAVWKGVIYTFGDVLIKDETGRFSCLLQTGVEYTQTNDLDAVGISNFRELEGIWTSIEFKTKDALLTVAEGRFGGMPCFLYEDDINVIFSSGIKPILAAVPGRGSLSLPKLLGMVLLGTPPEFGDQTLFERISILPCKKVHSFNLDSGSHTSFDYLRRYTPAPLWVSACKREISQVALSFRQKMREAVRRNLSMHIPIALPLSGGVDSSILAVELKETSIPFTAFTVTYPECKGAYPDEERQASLTAKRLGIPLYRIEIKRDDILDLTDELVLEHEVPVLTPGFHVAWILFHSIKKHGFDKIFSGDGGDGALGGDAGAWLGAFLKQKPFKALAEWYKWGGNLSLRSAVVGYLYFFSPQTRKFVDNLRFHKVLTRWIKIKPEWPKWYESSSFDYANLNKDMVTKVIDHVLRGEKARAIHNNLRISLPFLDLDLRNYMENIPESFKMYRGWRKYLARFSYSDSLPHEVIWNRRKIGFDVPLDLWMNGVWHRKLKEEVLECRRWSEILDLAWMKSNFETLPIHLRWRFYTASRFIALFESL